MKLAAILLILARIAGAQIAVVGVPAGAQSTLGITATTPAINAFPASCVLVNVVAATGCGATLTDSQGGNTYATIYDVTDVATGAEQKLFAAPKPGGGFTSSMTFTYAGTSCFPSIQAAAFSGTATSANCGLNPAAVSGSGSTIPFPLSITPGGPNQLWVSGLAGCQGATAPSPSIGTSVSPFACIAGTAYALGFTYAIQSGAATPVTVNWTYAAGTPQVNGGIASFAPFTAANPQIISGKFEASGKTIKQ